MIRWIGKIADLKGKTVAASAPGTAPYFTLAWMLKKNGLGLKDVKIVNLEPQAAANAMIAGTAGVDAAMTYEPYLGAVRAKPEAGKIIATTLDYPMVMDTFGCTPKFLAENPKAAKALADGYFDALAMIKADRLPAFAHSLGRVLLAQLPPAQLADHLPAGALNRLAPHTVTTRASLHQELSRIRERGWSFVNSELVHGLFGAAIALPSATGWSTVGLNVTSIGEPWTTEEVERRIVPALHACAENMKPITDALA